MRELRTEIEIAAPAEAVWDVLCDFDEYGDWNPFICEAVGICAEGERLTIRAGPIRGRYQTFRPRVLQAEAGRTLRWRGRLGIPGLLDGEHIFEIEPLGDEGVRFVQRERFTGALALLLPLVESEVRRGFDAMNAALRERAEARQGG